DLEAVNLGDVGRVDRRYPEVIVDDQGADHDSVLGGGTADASGMGSGRGCIRQPGSTAVKTAPPSWPTLTVPPLPSTICLTRARPRPRRAPVTEDLVVTPSVKIWSRSSCGTPGPVSRTLTKRSASAATTVSSTSRGAGASAAASIALSIRLPTTVSTS